VSGAAGPRRGCGLVGLVALALLEAPAVACAQDVERAPHTVRVGDLVYRARVDVSIDSLQVVTPEGDVAVRPVARLRTAVSVTNVGRRPVALGRWPNCFFTTIELWPTAAARRWAAGVRRVPAWDEERWRLEHERATRIIIECDFARELPEREIAPGDSATFEPSVRPRVREVLGDSLPAGRYRAVLRVRPHRGARAGRPSVRLAAGEVVLRSEGAVGQRSSPRS
jgi:hypothetical protein